MKTLALVGLGHAHLEIVRQFTKRPPADTRLVCLSASEDAAYSGLLPAVLSGQADEEGMTIHLRELCSGPNVELVVERVTGLSAADQTIRTESGRVVAFDICSVDIGSEPQGDLCGQPNYVPVRPMLRFLKTLREKLSHVPAGDAARVLVVGGGLGGVELAYSLPTFLEQETGRVGEVTIVERNDRILPSLPHDLSGNVADELRDRGIRIRAGHTVAPSDNGVRLSNGTELAPHVVIDATAAHAPAMLRDTDLRLTGDGFLEIEPTLRTTGHPNVFAAGDCATCLETPWPKSGVYAVRQAPVLWHNLTHALVGQELKRFKPQKQALKLINRGDGTAWGTFGGSVMGGRWVQGWKNQLDKRFVKKYDPKTAETEPAEV